MRPSCSPSPSVLGLLGLLLVVLAMRGRRKRGLGSGETVALDDVTLFSERLKLVGRPDRIVRQGEHAHPRGMEVLEAGERRASAPARDLFPAH